MLRYFCYFNVLSTQHTWNSLANYNDIVGALTTFSRLSHVVWWLKGWAWIPNNEMNLSISMPTPATGSTLP